MLARPLVRIDGVGLLDAYNERLSGSIVVALCRNSGTRCSMAAALVTFHVTSYAESFSTPGLWALVRLLSSVAVAVYAQAAWSREGLVACRADVAILRLWKCRLARCADVVVMLPWVRASCTGAWDRHWKRHSLGLEVRR
jgi:hypothetical protein